MLVPDFFQDSLFSTHLNNQTFLLSLSIQPTRPVLSSSCDVILIEHLRDPFVDFFVKPIDETIIYLRELSKSRHTWQIPECLLNCSGCVKAASGDLYSHYSMIQFIKINNRHTINRSYYMQYDYEWLWCNHIHPSNIWCICPCILYHCHSHGYYEGLVELAPTMPQFPRPSLHLLLLPLLWPRDFRTWTFDDRTESP